MTDRHTADTGSNCDHSEPRLTPREDALADQELADFVSVERPHPGEEAEAVFTLPHAAPLVRTEMVDVIDIEVQELDQPWSAKASAKIKSVEGVPHTGSGAGRASVGPAAGSPDGKPWAFRDQPPSGDDDLPPMPLPATLEELEGDIPDTPPSRPPTNQQRRERCERPETVDMIDREVRELYSRWPALLEDHSLCRLAHGRYRINGRRVMVQIVTREAEDDREDSLSCSEDMLHRGPFSDLWVDSDNLVVRDGTLSQPFLDYVFDTGRGECYSESVSAIAPPPRFGGRKQPKQPEARSSDPAADQLAAMRQALQEAGVVRPVEVQML